MSSPPEESQLKLLAGKSIKRSPKKTMADHQDNLFAPDDLDGSLELNGDADVEMDHINHKV